MEVPGVVVDEGQHGEEHPGDAGGQPPAAQQGEEDQRQAEGGHGVEGRIDGPLSGQIVGGDAVRQFQLIPRDEGGGHCQQAGQHSPEEDFFPVYGF